LRRKWRAEQASALAGKRVIFIDETGVNLSLARRYGRARAGRRAVGSVPKNYGESVSLIGALDERGVIAGFAFRGATDGAAMQVFLREVLLPHLVPGDIIVWDNLSVHKTRAVQQLFEQAQVELLFLPPYSPDLNPIELCWSKLKTFLRAKAART